MILGLYRIVPPITEKLVEDVTTQPSSVYEKVIARRILLELIEVFKEKGTPVLVNLGIGIPALVSSVAAREHKRVRYYRLESGPWGELLFRDLTLVWR